LVAQNKSFRLSEKLSPKREQQQLTPFLCFEGSPKQRPLVLARVVLLERDLDVPSVLILAQVRAGGMREGFLSPE